eukprot:TRINITY_DN306_c0_g2_i1.p1 TRINITY_DN306_c0_g2~~TRINITY_DN306_c0_g2_i1.p1  ORF type:complete len:162 (-),score=61.21 TRINITY_DN306_c0_g2_i1:178-663(-)
MPWASPSSSVAAGFHALEEEVCHRLHLQIVEKVSVNGRLKSEDCVACRFLVKEAKKKLKDPKNQAKLSEFLEESCGKIPNQNISQQCLAAVDQYLPMIFANLDQILDPAKVCVGFCSFGASTSSSSSSSSSSVGMKGAIVRMLQPDQTEGLSLLPGSHQPR